MLFRLLSQLKLNTLLKRSQNIPLIFFNSFASKLVKMPPKKANSKRKVIILLKSKKIVKNKSFLSIKQAEQTPIKPIVSDPFSAAKKSKKEEKITNENEEEINEIKEINDYKNESEIEVQKPAKNNTVQPKIKSLFASKPIEDNGDNKAKKGKKKTKKDDDEDDGDENEEGEEKAKEIKYNPEDFIKTTNNKEYNFKMVTFNVNGIRASIEVS